MRVLASEKREVASYDQIGCARSPYAPTKKNQNQNQTAAAAPPAPRDTYTPALFGRELTEVRRATGLGRVHVVAHGWGGMLALDHILGGNGVDGGGRLGGSSPSMSIASLTLVSVPPSYARLIADRREARANARRVRAGAPRRRRGGAGGGNLSDAGRKLYAIALDEWTRLFVSKRAAGACYRGLKTAGAGGGFGARANDPPDAVGVVSARAVARDMTGGCLFEAGALSGWDADDGGRLAMLAAAVPGGVRFVRGEDDALSDEGAREVYDAVAGHGDDADERHVRVVPDSGSCVHLDKSADFLESTAAYVAARDA